MTDIITTEISATDSWSPPRDGVLKGLFLFDIYVAELLEDRWTRELVLTDGMPQAHNIHPTRAAAIRASVASSIREARTQHRTPRDLYDTNPAFDMNAEQLRVYVGWLRGVAASEAPRKQAAIERYERGCRRATGWIADREVELGVAGMHPNAPGYPVQLSKAWAKYVEYQGILKGLRKPDETAPVIDTPPKRIRFGTALTDHIFLDVGQVDGAWFSAWSAYLQIYGRTSAPLVEGNPHASEEKAIEAALRQIHHWLENVCGASGKPKERAQGWVGGLAAERGIELRVAADIPVSEPAAEGETPIVAPEPAEATPVPTNLDGPILLRKDFGRKGEDYALIDVRRRDGGGWLVAHECRVGNAAGYWSPAGARNSDPFDDAHSALEHAVFSIDWLIKAHPEKKAAPTASAWLSEIVVRFGIDIDAERTRRSESIARFEEERLLQQQEIEANRPRIDPNRDLVSLDVGHLGATVESRPIQDALWLAVAGYRYNGIAGHPAHDAGIGRFATSEEALAAGVDLVRKGAEDVLRPDFGNDVPAARKKQAKATLA